MNEWCKHRFEKRLLLTLGVSFLFVITLATIVYAGVNWGTPTFGSGTTGWNGTNYVQNIDAVTGLGGDVVCLDWSYTDQSSAGHSGSVPCSRTTGNDYQCLLPGSSVPNANTSGIAWTLRSKTPNCSGAVTSTGPSSAASPGKFAPNGTGPNAITLNRFAAARDATGWQLAAVAMLGLLGLGAGLWWARNRRQALVG